MSTFIIKRNGEKEDIRFDKITERIKKLINPIELNGINLEYSNSINEEKYLNPVVISQKVVANIYSGITTEELDIESAKICANMSTTHPLYSYLGGRILVSNLHKKTSKKFSEKMIQLYYNTNNINDEFIEFVKLNATELDNIINYNFDYLYDYFGFKTLEKSYLLKIDNKVIERPQDMILRTCITLNLNDLENIKKMYNNMSHGYYTHASPTLFNSGTKHMQLSSCFLLGTKDDLDAIGDTWKACSKISKWAGGIGLHVSNIRGKQSKINGTGGLTNGLVPFLKIFDNIARWVDQGGKRPGSIAVYLEPHHPDIFEFLDLRKNFGADTERTRDLFLSLWISDLFMKQVENDDDWYLLSADECPNLPDRYGEEYEKLYWKYVKEGKYREKIKARKIWSAILDSQIETGIPYIGFKDAVNNKSNQKNLGTIKSSNLCIEITEFSNDKEFAVCNLASISLKHFVKAFNNNNNEWIIYTKPDCKYCKFTKNYLDNLNINYKEIEYNNLSIDSLKNLLNTSFITYPQIFIKKNKDNILITEHLGGWSELYKYTKGRYDYDKLYEIAYTATVNLNKVIDINYYPVRETKLSNMKHRPIGLGIQGLADTLVLLKIPYDCDEALDLNARIMETIYLAFITASNDISIERYEPMKKLIDYINKNDINYPEFYCNEFNLNNESINKIYHDLKPNKYELQKDISLSTLGAYSSFEGSPFSEGKFQFDLWDDNTDLYYKEEWLKLREKVKKFGTRNSLGTACMPTASTSQILGNNECFEFFTNNIYTRKTQAGDFILVNKYLINDLINIGLWNNTLKDKIIANNGSIQSINEIPIEIKKLYKIMWEIKQVWSLKAAKARGPFIDQTQSMNVFMAEPDYQRLNSSHFWAWKNGLKTGMYYLRTKPSIDAIKFTINPNLQKSTSTESVIECETCSA
jgi:ribonucleoside-diphosphate reductase alpha subunit